MNKYQEKKFIGKFSPILHNSLNYLAYSVTDGSEEFTAFLNQYLSVLYGQGVTVFRKQLLK